MTTAFVLSGGGSLGAVQVGMLSALADHDIAPRRADRRVGRRAQRGPHRRPRVHARCDRASRAHLAAGCAVRTSSRSRRTASCSLSPARDRRCARPNRSDDSSRPTSTSTDSKMPPSPCTSSPPMCCLAPRSRCPPDRRAPRCWPPPPFPASSRPSRSMARRCSMAASPTTRRSVRPWPSAPIASSSSPPGSRARFRHHLAQPWRPRSTRSRC